MGLDTVELVMAVEAEFGFVVANDVAATFVRLGDLHGFAVRALRERGEPAEPGVVWERLKRVVVQRCAVSEALVVPGAHLAYDLGLD